MAYIKTGIDMSTERLGVLLQTDIPAGQTLTQRKQ